MKLYKLITHQKNFSGKYSNGTTLFVYFLRLEVVIIANQNLVQSIAEDLILNPKDHPDAKIGDVVEIYLPEDDGVRLLLQITSFQEDKKGTKGMANSKQSISTILAA